MSAAKILAMKDHPTPSLQSMFDTLVSDIVSGKYPQGSRLPPERDLSRMLGASRPTLREALRRLGEWGLVEPRRGSGVVVRDMRDWSLDVLPAYLRLGAPAHGPRALAELIVDLLALRKQLLLDVFRTVGLRMPPHSLDEARAAVDRAWASRDDLESFVRADFDMLRSVLLAARFLPALWLMNGLSSVYLEMARTLTGAIMIGEGYREAHHAVLDALERRDPDAAGRLMADYLDNLDKRLLGAMGLETAVRQ
jgi:DNA-binding FadR family transcriptional regulator